MRDSQSLAKLVTAVVADRARLDLTPPRRSALCSMLRTLEASFEAHMEIRGAYKALIASPDSQPEVDRFEALLERIVEVDPGLAIALSESCHDARVELETQNISGPHGAETDQPVGIDADATDTSIGEATIGKSFSANLEGDPTTDPSFPPKLKR